MYSHISILFYETVTNSSVVFRILPVSFVEMQESDIGTRGRSLWQNKRLTPTDIGYLHIGRNGHFH
jgi:hypothetical protein